MSAVAQYVPPTCYVRPYMPGDVWLVLPTVLQSDIDELAALGVTPKMCIEGGVKNSKRVFSIFLHGEMGGVFGAVEHADHAVPWAVFTTAIERHPLPFLRVTRQYVDSLPMRLENAVYERNKKTITWLRWLGFTLEEPQPLGNNGELFQRFWRCAIGSSH